MLGVAKFVAALRLRRAATNIGTDEVVDDGFFAMIDPIDPDWQIPANGVTTGEAGDRCVVLCSLDKVLRSRLQMICSGRFFLRIVDDLVPLKIAIKTQNVAVALIDGRMSAEENAALMEAASIVQRPLRVLVLTRENGDQRARHLEDADCQTESLPHSLEQARTLIRCVAMMLQEPPAPSVELPDS